MTVQHSLIKKIISRDDDAAKLLVERYSAPLFRYCRLNFNDHFRAGEFVEEFLGEFLFRLRSGELSIDSIEPLFVEADQVSQLRKNGNEPARGLSKKQRRILELMTSLPFPDRLVLDLVLLESHSSEDVQGWFDLPAARIQEIQDTFKDMLSSDETIREFLEYAAIQQAKQRKAQERSKAGPGRSVPSQQPVKPKRETSKRELSGPQTVTRWSADDEKPCTDSDNTGRDSEKESAGDNEECKKPRPRRRRVDPRKLDFEL